MRRALLGFVVLLLGTAACNGPGRFPTCKDDAECAARVDGTAAPLCYELRCVVCRSDDDCPTGHACTKANECSRFSETGAVDADGGAPKKEVIEKESWEPSTSEDRQKCLDACKDKPKECTARCGGGTPPKKK